MSFDANANFHIRFLVSAGHIKKQDDRYELSVEFEGGRNEWLTNKELEDQDKVFEDITKISDIAKKPGIHFIELKRYYEDKDY